MVRVMICALFVAGIVSAHAMGTKQDAERAVFYGDDKSVENSVPLPENVLKVLLETAEVQEVLSETPGLDRDKLAQFFSVIEVHLSNPKDDVDYIVVGHPPMNGADSTWFWVVRSAQTHPQIVLFAHTNSIELLKGKNKGFKNIQSVWKSGAGYISTRVYEYDGEQYKLLKEDWSGGDR
jgi:hypothetical protein